MNKIEAQAYPATADFQQVENKVISILEDIEPWALDDTGLHIPDTEIEKAAKKIMCILTAAMETGR